MRSTLPIAARRRLSGIGAGWVLAALAEAGAYTVLAFAIRDRGDALPVLIAAVVSLVVTVLVSRAGYLGGARMAGDLYSQLGRSLAVTKLSWFTADHRALVTAVSGRSIPSLMGVPAHQLQTLICSPLVPVLLIAAVGFVSGGRAAGMLALLLLVSLAVQILAQRRLMRADADRLSAEGDATRATMELVDHLELFRTAAGCHGLDRAEEVWARQERASARTNRAAAPATLISVVASVVPLAGMMVMIAVSGGFADPHAALALLVLTARAAAPIDDFALVGVALNDVRSQIGVYHAVMVAPRLPAPDGKTVPDGHDIELYEVVQPPALHGVSGEIPEGSRTHVAGPSGAGKSTLLELLLRFDDPAAGAIVLGGAPLTALDEADISARIAYVPQDPVVLSGTLAENVRIGRPGASDDAIIESALRAQLGELIARDPRGIHQSVGIHGQSLSGGERQRVAIARALLKNAPVLVMDEATSALDEATEKRIADALADDAATLIVVTHRDPAIWRPDRTIVLKGTQPE